MNASEMAERLFSALRYPEVDPELRSIEILGSHIELKTVDGQQLLIFVTEGEPGTPGARVRELEIALDKREARIQTIRGALERGNITQARIWAGCAPEETGDGHGRG